MTHSNQYHDDYHNYEYDNYGQYAEHYNNPEHTIPPKLHAQYFSEEYNQGGPGNEYGGPQGPYGPGPYGPGRGRGFAPGPGNGGGRAPYPPEER